MLIPVTARVHDRQPTLRALHKVQHSPEIDFVGTLTLYRNAKDPKMTAVHIGKTEKRSSSGPLFINESVSFICLSWCGTHERQTSDKGSKKFSCRKIEGHSQQGPRRRGRGRIHGESILRAGFAKEGQCRHSIDGALPAASSMRLRDRPRRAWTKARQTTRGHYCERGCKTRRRMTQEE